MRKWLIVMALVGLSMTVEKPALALVCTGQSPGSLTANYSGSATYSNAGKVASAYIFVALRTAGELAIFGYYNGGGSFFFTGSVTVGDPLTCLLGGTVTNSATGQTLYIVIRHVTPSYIELATPFDPSPNGVLTSSLLFINP
jgi:hypothetical protein